jgi:hypothetical protein
LTKAPAGAVMTETHAEDDGAPPGKGSLLARMLARIGLRSIGWALPRLSLSERVAALRELQRRTIATFGKTDVLARRRYAAKSLESCIENAPAEEQPEMLTGAARRSLQRIDAKHVFDACRSLTNLVRIHPRLSDPASFTARGDSEGLVVVGPWLMEVGFELLYWIPYLRAELSRLGIPKERVIAISRGGAELWYTDIASRYLDILDVMTPDEFHQWTSGGGDGGDALEGFRKPFAAGPFETTVLDKVVKKAGIDDYRVIMPSAMYSLLRNVWRSRFGKDELERHLAPTRIAPPAPLELPFEGPYVVAKFYHSSVFPKIPETEAFAVSLIRQLAARNHVVLLSNVVQLDDHSTLRLGRGGSRYRIFDASQLYGPRDNLAKQTALVAHAKELHGTYGGFSYLGPLLGVDTVAYIGKYDFLSTHLDLAWTTFDKIGGGRLAMMPAGHGAWALRGRDEINEAAE